MKQTQLLSGKISDLIKKKKPLVMGILNVTPDSFSDGGKYYRFEDAIKHAKELIDQGVDIIDIGGKSTRPGAGAVSEEEELRRVISVIKLLVSLRAKRSNLTNNITNVRLLRRSAPRNDKIILISIDTYKSNVARTAIEAGADIINDVSGLTKDPNMVKVAAEYDCPIVIMHNKGIPATKPVLNTEDLVLSKKIQNSVLSTQYSVLINEVYTWLQNQTNFAIANGVKRENIIIDPGIGFGKSAEEDLYLIKNLSKLKSLGFPILVGVSRKSFIRKLFLGCDIEVKSRELAKLAIKNGADIVRVHL